MLPLGVQGVLAGLAAAEHSRQGADLCMRLEMSLLNSPWGLDLSLLSQPFSFKVGEWESCTLDKLSKSQHTQGCGLSLFYPSGALILHTGMPYVPHTHPPPHTAIHATTR